MPSNNQIPTALKYFDTLPDIAFVRQPVVEALFTYSATSVWRDVHAGRIPKTKKLSLNNHWLKCWRVENITTIKKVIVRQG